MFSTEVTEAPRGPVRMYLRPRGHHNSTNPPRPLGFQGLTPWERFLSPGSGWEL